MRPRRGIRERDRPAARARKARQHPLGHLPGDLRVDDLRPPRIHRLRAIQPRLAGPAFRRRIRGLHLTRVRVPFQALPLMTGLPAPLAVLPALPLGLLPRPPRRLRPDTLLRAGRPRITAVHRQPPLQLRDPQLQPPLTLPRRFQTRREHRDLLVLRLDHSPQPRDKATLLANRTRPTGHEPKACSTCTKSSTTSARRRVAFRPREWTLGIRRNLLAAQVVRASPIRRRAAGAGQTHREAPYIPAVHLESAAAAE